MKGTFIHRAVFESVRSHAVVHVVLEFSFIKRSRGMLQDSSALHLEEESMRHYTTKSFSLYSEILKEKSYFVLTPLSDVYDTISRGVFSSATP